MSQYFSTGMTTFSAKRFQPRANFAIIALLSFILSFIVARTFTTFFPSTVLVSNGIHVHHFWFGIVLLAIGGWLGISYNDVDADRLAAILYGAGGGLIIDEVGLLLTFGDYWTNLTYTILTVFIALVIVLILFNSYRQAITKEFGEFFSSNFSLYFGAFLLAVSVAFIVETDDVLVTDVSTGLTIAAMVIIAVYLARRIFEAKERNTQNSNLTQE
jgi:hypothetical protein